MRENAIYITQFDLGRLRALLHFGDSFRRHDADSLQRLADELDRAEIVEPGDVPTDVVTMNSRVRLQNLDTGVEIICSVVFPRHADRAANKFSVLAPIGMAVLGAREGETVEWEFPGGSTRLKILEILYQPEAAGDQI